jgi:hypothetical protein
MSPHVDSSPSRAFRHAVEALCLSRDDIARELHVSRELLDGFVDSGVPVPAITQLALVDVLKAHEARVGGAAGVLYEQAMRHLVAAGGQTDASSPPSAHAPRPPGNQTS